MSRATFRSARSGPRPSCANTAACGRSSHSRGPTSGASAPATRSPSASCASRSSGRSAVPPARTTIVRWCSPSRRRVAGCCSPAMSNVAPSCELLSRDPARSAVATCSRSPTTVPRPLPARAFLAPPGRACRCSRRGWQTGSAIRRRVSSTACRSPAAELCAPTLSGQVVIALAPRIAARDRPAGLAAGRARHLPSE